MATGSTPLIDPTLQPLFDQLIAGVNTEIGNLNTDKASLASQRDELKQLLLTAQQQLAAVTADDSSVAAKLLAAQAQATRLAQLSNAGVALALHRLPYVTDPNARPVMTWFQPSNTGNSGGGSAQRHGTWTITPNDDGSTDFAIVPASPFDNYIWGLNFFKATRADLHRFLQVTEFELADEDVPNAMAIETNWEQSLGGFRFNAGLQALLGTDKDAVTGKLVTNQWRYFDIGFKTATGKVGAWLDTGIPFDRSMFGTGKRIELVSEFERSDDPAQGMHNISLTINGTPHTVDKWSKAKATTWGPFLQQGFQKDTLSSAAGYKAKVWNMEAYWM